MDLLLDTHVFLWWDTGRVTLDAIADPGNRVFVSAASVWEIGIKAVKGKLSYSGSPLAAIGDNGFLPLSITSDHAERAARLDWSHGDPFDRMLVAQAGAEGLVLVTADQAIQRFRGVALLPI